ncbi:MAG: agmatine deiminase family protein [Bacteroidales bacterium]|nr:agmatine deiminase family protein [Bacteroidales bacterium]
MKKYYVFRSIILCLFLSLVFQSFGQEDYSKYLTSFSETNPPTGEIRFPAEFEPVQAVVVAHYQTSRNLPVRLIKEMAEDCKVITLVNSEKWFTTQEVKTLYSSGGVNIDNCEFIEVPLSGRWTRDYAPWFIFDDGKPAIVDNIYDRVFPGSGNNNPSQTNDDAISAKFAEYYDVPLYGMKIVHTGGNMMQDGRGIAVSDSIVITESAKYVGVDADAVHQKMKDYLGIDTYHVTVDPQGDYIAHVDCWGKFLAPDKILLARVEATHAQYEKYESVAKYFEKTNCCWGYPYQVYRVDVPTRSGNKNIASPYTNSLILNNKVFVPLDADTDEYYNNAALAVYEKAMPGYEIIGIEYNCDSEGGDWDGWYNTDALHCRTREIMDFNMLFVDHREVLHGDVAQKDSYPITAKFIAYSGDAITSTQLHYSINDGDWQTVDMSVQGTSGEYKASITGCNVGDNVKYYLTGEDASGRTCAQPYFAELEPHSFTVVAGAGGDDSDNDSGNDNDDDNDIADLNTFTGKGSWNSATSWSKWNVPADNEDVVVKGDVTIPNGTTVIAGKIYIVDGSITIEDGGQLIHNQEDLVATVNKNISGYGTDNSWHTISSPLKGKADIANISGLVTATGNYDLYYYDEPTHYWINHKVGTNDFTTLDAGRGYLYANSENTTLKFTGTLNNDDVQYQLTTDATDVLTGFHLIGNPFTHNIYMENNTVSSDFAFEGYYALSGDGNWSATPLSNATAIAPCQGVLIQTNVANTLTIVKNHKAPNTRSVQPALNITVANEKYDDKTYVLFKKGLGLNKVAHMNENIPMVYVIDNNEKLAIATMNDNVKEVSLGFEAMTMGEYTIAVKAQDCKFNNMTLIDKMTGEKTNLLTDSYTFMATTSDSPDRFTLTLNADNDNDADFIYINNNEMIINNIEGNGLVQIYDMMGRSVATYNVSGSANISMETLSEGVYIVRMTDANGVKTEKVVNN